MRSQNREIYGDTAEWIAMPWWPKGSHASIRAGWTGHDHEICVNLAAFDDAVDNPIPDPVFQVIWAQLPDGWKAENRGSRIEVHPSGRFAGGYAHTDIADVVLALMESGFTVDYVNDARTEESGG